MPTPEEIQASIALFDADVQRFNDILLGNENSEVEMSDETLRPSIAKAVLDRVDLFTNTIIYNDTTDGLAATTNGKYFFVPQSSPSATLYDLYKNNAGTALYINSYPAKAAFKSLFTYNGTDSKIPLVVNATGELLAWFDKTTGYISQFVSPNDTYISAAITASLKASSIGKSYTYSGSLSGIIPIVTGADGSVLIGWDTVNNRQVGVYEQGALAANAALAANSLIGKSFTYTASSTDKIHPIVVTADGFIVDGYNKQTGKAVTPSFYSESDLDLLDAADVPSTTDWRMVMWDGESTTVGAFTDALNNTTQPYSNLTFGLGPSSSKVGSSFYNQGCGTVIPLVETTGRAETNGTGIFETPVSSTLNYAVERSIIEDAINHQDLVLFGSAAGHSGYTISQLVWGQAWAQLKLDQVSEFAARAVESSKTKSIAAIILDVTVNDAAAATSQAAYTASLRSYIQGAQTNLKSLTGQTTPVHVFIVMASTYTHTSAGKAIALAIQDVVRTEPYAWLLPPVYHIPFYSDTIHMRAVGYDWKGKVAGKHLKTLLDGKKPKALNPLVATYKDGFIRVKFAIRHKPLVLDRINIGVVNQNGARALDGSGDIILGNARVVGDGDTLEFTTSRAPTTNAKIRFALDYPIYGSPNTYNGYLSGATNIRDSYDDYAIIDDVKCYLFDVCPASELSITTLG